MTIKSKELQFADVVEIQRDVTAELRNVQNEKFSAAFTEAVR
jgi:hypothetical protein